jgi:hypothetical protein
VEEFEVATSGGFWVAIGAYPDIQGLYYGSSMNGHASAIALNDRAQRAIPKQPQLHRALNDDLLVEVLQRIALRLSYGLR